MKTDNGLEPPTVLTQATNQLQADGAPRGKSFLEPKSCKICITMPYAQQLCGLQIVMSHGLACNHRCTYCCCSRQSPCDALHSNE